jgi:hypothetical protein
MGQRIEHIKQRLNTSFSIPCLQKRALLEVISTIRIGVHNKIPYPNGIEPGHPAGSFRRDRIAFFQATSVPCAEAAIRRPAALIVLYRFDILHDILHDESAEYRRTDQQEREPK